MCQRHHRHSIFCILPPQVLDQIVRNGKKADRDWALDALHADNTQRAMRASGAVQPARKTRSNSHPGEIKRTVYTAKNKSDLPGKSVRDEDDGPHKDAAVNQAFDALGATHGFFWEVFQRNSIDDEGLPLLATVHYGKKYPNAFWDGAQMVFGDGDGKLFNSFTASLDVIGHELAHGVTQDEAQLAYFNQAGALNESMSDVFGSLVKQYALKQTADKADWLIGAELLTKEVKGVALRSLAAPGTAYDDPVLGKDPQPAHMKDYVRTSDDNGGVHTNSGIPNHAFYLAARAIGGHAWEKAGLVWYDTLRDKRLKPNAGFAAFAKLTVNNAVTLFGSGSKEAKAIKEAWVAVGVKV
ncbi:M4 family metallopeptidase [Derxia lacustris]|uniref:M4 family metallopeptidase n=1 Tax=Derxia lacustris TaxID=764842 RepID=UPI000A16D3E5|nr:M4 family metallopeptidase [Derxia lacustris]